MPLPIRTLILAACLALAPAALHAEDVPLRGLQTGNDMRGWDAVGRLDMGAHGFCTGALIAPHLVLTAAHCLFDKSTGARIATDRIEFRAGWRNGRAAAYRGVQHAVAHPDYLRGGDGKLDRVAFDLAVIELDQPIRLPSILPFDTDREPAKGDSVGVVSYAQNRAEVPSLQEVCHVIARQTEVLVLSCDVDFGSSGAPVFALRDGEARMVSVVSAKADFAGRRVALGTTLDVPLDRLLTELRQVSATFQRPGEGSTGSAMGTAKFVKP